MNEKNYLVFFLNSVKDELSFLDADDFSKKIKNSFKFRFKVQKFVFISKYFGWNHNYNFSLYIHGPYSNVLSNEYYSNIFEYNPLIIDELNIKEFKEFICDKSDNFLEAASTILFISDDKNFSLEYSINQLSKLKPHIPLNVVKDAYYEIKDFNLFDNDIKTILNVNLDAIKEDVHNKVMYHMELFKKFNLSNNQIIVLGSLDYIRIVLREENLNYDMKFDMLSLFEDYVNYIEKIYGYCKGNTEIFETLDLTDLDDFFDRLQNFVSQELDLIPRLDSDDFDESLCY